MGLISKAIRDDDRTVYKAEVSRSSLETLSMIEEFLDYEAIVRAIACMDKEAFFEAISDIFSFLGGAFLTELEFEVSLSSNSDQFASRLKSVHRRVIQATSKVLDRVLEMMAKDPRKAFQLMLHDIS